MVLNVLAARAGLLSMNPWRLSEIRQYLVQLIISTAAHSHLPLGSGRAVRRHAWTKQLWITASRDSHVDHSKVTDDCLLYGCRECDGDGEPLQLDTQSAD